MEVKSKKITPPYFGNGPYCYADSTAMLLASIAEKILPSKIEVLSGVGLGACLLKGTNLLFFNWALPTFGIDHALKTLGFTCKAMKKTKTDPPPLDELNKDLKKSPAIIGPLDMGYLTYDPDYLSKSGFDHFVLAYKMDHKEIYLHDPAGLPFVSLPMEEFRLAWKAEQIDYGKDSYQYWTNPKRIEKPTDKEIYDRAIKLFKLCYQESQEFATQENRVTGRKAILTVAKRVKTGKASQDEIDLLIHFALPLGARRALDFAQFFDFKDKDLANLKRKQAELFGRCHTLAVRKKWKQFADALEQLANIEEKICLTMMAK